MKLHYSQSAGRWCIGGKELHCGQIVKIKATNTTGREFWIFGRFEIAGQNNPVFYTTFGRVVPELAETIFEL